MANDSMVVAETYSGKEKSETSTQSHKQLASDLDGKCTIDIRSDIPDEKPPVSTNEGEKILIEKDGRFKLVDASELKAEYYDVLNESKNNLTKNKPKCDTTNSRETQHTRQQRPKTCDTGQASRRSNITQQKQRPMTAVKSVTELIRPPNPDYAHITSRYAMSEQQLEMKRRRESAIARRKREEEARRQEENELQRQEAERAFKAWLDKKNVESQKQLAERIKCQDENSSDEKELSTDRAYRAWLTSKAEQLRRERELNKAKMAEEAASYTVRDENLCDEAFRRWKRKKLKEQRMRNSPKFQGRQWKSK